MKKMVVLFACSVFIALFACCSATAENRTNPRRRHVEKTIQWRDAGPGVFESNGPTLVIQCNRAPLLSKPGLFTAVVQNSSGTNWIFEYGITDTVRDPSGYIYFSNGTTNNTLEDFRFYTQGEYELFVYLYNAQQYDPDSDDNEPAAMDSYRFTIAAEAGYPTLEEKAQEIVNERKAAGNDWQTSLNLHDWLTENVVYDETYEYYGADVLFREKGVCDSYSKAFKLLCNTAGVTAERVTSKKQNHAWNVIRLGSIWYQVDVTWDDNDASRIYFCLSDDAMYLDHTRLDVSYDPGCPSMDMNYYIVMDAWQVFGNYDTSGDTVAGFFRERLEQGYANAAFSLENWEYYWPDNNRGYSIKPAQYAIYVTGLQISSWTLGINALKIDFELNQDDNCVAMNVSGWDLAETGTLVLPPSIPVIAENAFEGIKATTVVIPDGCSAIEAGAFRNSGVRKMYVPGTVTSFAENTFDGCGCILFILDTPDSEFADFARQEGHLVSEP